MEKLKEIKRIPYDYYAVRTELGIEVVPVKECRFADRVGNFVKGKNILQTVFMRAGQQTFSTSLKHFEESSGIKSQESTFCDGFGKPCDGWRVIPNSDIPGSLIQCLNQLGDFVFESSHSGYAHLKPRSK